MNTARSGGSVFPSSMCVVPFLVVERLPTSVMIAREGVGVDRACGLGRQR
jgi:hypothetical protein